MNLPLHRRIQLYRIDWWRITVAITFLISIFIGYLIVAYNDQIVAAQQDLERANQRTRYVQYEQLHHEAVMIALLNQDPVDTDAGDRVTCKVRDKAGMKHF